MFDLPFVYTVFTVSAIVLAGFVLVLAWATRDVQPPDLWPESEVRGTDGQE
jgi:hypothetical protein